MPNCLVCQNPLTGSAYSPCVDQPFLAAGRGEIDFEAVMILVDHGDDGALVHRLAGGGFAQQALIGEAAGVPILLGVSGDAY